jgi:hypothetical protein
MRNEIDKNKNSLITQLIKSYMGVGQGDSYYQSVFDYTKNYLDTNSLLYSYKVSEIENKIQRLIEKFEINLQFEKANLVQDLIKRLRTVFSSKKVDLELLYYILYIIVELAHSPLQTNINIEMLREHFEERYIRVESDKIVKNMNIEGQPYVYDSKNYFEPVNYDSESIDEDLEVEESKVEIKQEVAEAILKESIAIRPSIGTYLKTKFENKIIKTEIRLTLYKTLGLDRSLTERLILHNFKMNLRYNSKHHEAFSIQLFNMCYNKMRFINHIALYNFNHDNIGLFFKAVPERILFKPFIDLNYILSIILSELIKFNISELGDNNIFYKKFSKYNSLDISNIVIENALNEFNIIKNNLNLLKSFDLILEKHHIPGTLVIGNFMSNINDFLTLHDRIISSYISLLNYQKSKIAIKNLKTEKKDIQKLLSLSIDFTENTLYYQDILVHEHNQFIKSHLFDKKLTLLLFLNRYRLLFSNKIDYYINICKSIIEIKKALDEQNRYSTYLLNKMILDLIFGYTKDKFNHTNKDQFYFLFENFINPHFAYLKMIYEFMINGNLIDLHNEFFIDHVITKKDNKKIIFNFNEKFKSFNWLNSFKIKSFKLDSIDSACVPCVFMIDGIHFKILETAKSTFLLKNLKNHELIDFDLLLNEQDLGLRTTKSNVYKFLDSQLVISHNREEPGEYNLQTPNRQENVDKDIIYLNRHINKEKRAKEDFVSKLPFNLSNYTVGLNLVQEYRNMSFFESKPLQLGNFEKSEKKKSEYKSYFLTNGKVEKSNEISELQNICKGNVKSSESSTFFNIDHVMKDLVLNKILTINILINKKILGFLINEERLKDHFSLMFNLYLFKAGFSMNKFIHDFDNFLKRDDFEEDNFYLKSIISDISNNSDLVSFKDKIEKFVTINLKKDINKTTLDLEDLVLMEYNPRLPISIFFDNSILKFYNGVFNYIILIKRLINTIKTASTEKKLKTLDLKYNTSVIGYLDSNILSQIKRIIKYFISLKLQIYEFIHNLEFHIFTTVR